MDSDQPAQTYEEWLEGLAVSRNAEVERLRAEVVSLREALARLDQPIRDTCWKATPFGHRDDWIVSYLLPAGPLHRLIGAAQAAGISAAFRNVSAALDVEDPTADLEAENAELREALATAEAAYEQVGWLYPNGSLRDLNWQGPCAKVPVFVRRSSRPVDEATQP